MIAQTTEKNPIPAKGPYSANQIYDVPMSEIYADEDFNCRGFLDPTEVIDLARDIREKGLIQPITLQEWNREGKRFRIICGYRRFKACRMNAITDEQPDAEIRAIIKFGLDDLDARIINLAENLQRSDLNIKQEAYAIDHFRRAGWSEPEVANKLKVSRAWVTVRFMLMGLPDDIQNEAAAGMLTQAQIRGVWRLRDDPEKQYELVRKIKDAKIKGNKREVTEEKVIKRNSKRLRTPSEIEEMQTRIVDVFGHSGATKALAWAGGFIDQAAYEAYLFDIAVKEGKYFEKSDLLKAEASDPMDMVA